MYEPKSRFAKRIKKPLNWVGVYCKRGIFPTNERGFIFVPDALKAFGNPRKRGRPRKESSERIIPVRVFVRRRQRKVIIEVAKELRNS